MVFRLVVEADSVEELVAHLEKLLDHLRQGREERSSSSRRVVVVFDETVRRAGELAKRIGADMGLDIEPYEVSSSVSEVTEVEGVKMLPVKDDLDVLRWCRQLGAVLVTGDKKLARTAEAYGIKVVYLPPADTVSREHYVVEAMKRLKKLLEVRSG